MIQSPITRVLSSMQRNGVDCLLMGGQACVLYGAAEFSRDIDFALHVHPDNLAKLGSALDELHARCIAVPPFDASYLDRGHAIHFRCHAPGVEKLRIDLMSRMRGVDPFPDLWKRRTTIEVDDLQIDLLALPDLIAAKRTQRDKDWLMTDRLIESHYVRHCQSATPEQVSFWLTESFDLELLARISAEFPEDARRIGTRREAVRALGITDSQLAARALSQERESIMQADRDYWAPLRKELEELRHA
jgi:hypothetical protein